MTGDVASFGALLSARRLSAGLSQEELAERSGLSVRAISNLERGRSTWPHPNTVRRLADALGLIDEPRADFLAAPARRLTGAVAEPVAAAGHPPAPDDSGQVVPRQLPASVRQFVGREPALAALTELLQHVGAGSSAVVISLIRGTAGVGKSALAVHWARQVASHFPDGQLYVDLRGYHPSGRPMAPAVAIRGFLDALAVPVQEVPAGLDAQAGLYRSLLSGKRMLVLLDNARDVGQVRPLLPGGSGCLVLVTSRNQLSGLVAAEDACAVTLDLLTEAESAELLARRLGPARLQAEPQAASELIHLCARLPLALGIASARASARPGTKLGTLAEELKDVQRRLDVLDAGDAASMRTVFSWSLDNLSADAARMFALLGVHPGPHFTLQAAASLAGMPLEQAAEILAELAESNLVAADSRGQYGLHDLLHAYATERAAGEDSASRPAALARVLDHYLHTAHAAALLLQPKRAAISLAPPLPGVTRPLLSNCQQALDWFASEHHVLIAAVGLAARTGFDACAWQLPWAMADYLDRRGHWHEWAAIQRTAVAAAVRLRDLAGQAAARRAAASASIRLADFDQARADLAVCLDLYQRLGDRSGEARARATLGWVAGSQGRYTEALGYDRQALDLFREAGDPVGQAYALNSVGWYHLLLGDPQQARAYCQEAIALHRATGDLAGQAHALDSLGTAEHRLGNVTRAADCYSRAHGIFCDLGDRYFQASSLANLGDARDAAGQTAGARNAWQQALEILDDLRHPDASGVRAKLSELSPVSRRSKLRPTLPPA